ncbi:MAG: metalloregulator ArsR/SmtB family transcription factor [Desulfobulbaceae bacterium]|nr:metalloregulator ArsR/SmtB family transcription factor [Desulfobulbaceae bacterium]HIJ90441.1 winged helix-turn-helix transcriptional regulator [Deltaproteobacteria bacterium]
MQDFIKVMKALSDPNRVKVLKMLQLKKKMCVCEIRAVLNLAQPTVSKHLKVLEEAGLIVGKKEKLWVNYRLNTTCASPHGAAMLTQLKKWLNEDPEIAEIHALLPSIDRKVLCRI